MKRSLAWIGLSGFLTVCLIVNHYWIVVVPLNLLAFSFMKEKHRLVYVIMLSVLVVFTYFHYKTYDKYDSYDKLIETEAVIKSKGSNYEIKYDGHKILLKNDNGVRLLNGRYHISYSKNTFFNQNPNMFNYKRYLKSKAYVDVAKTSQLTYTLIEEEYRFGIDLFKRLKERLKLSPYQGFYHTLLFNDKEHLDDGLYQQFLINGTGHVLAISGLHIGLIFACSYGIFKIYNKKLARLLSLIVAIVYVYYIHMPLSAVRALMMIGLSILAIYTNRKYDLLQSVGLIAYILLLYNPYIVFNAGFQYSFAAVIVIEVVYQSFFRHIKYKALQLILLPLSIQIGLLPLVVYHNNSFHLLSFLINIPTVILMSLILNSLLLLSIIYHPLFLAWIDFIMSLLIKMNEIVYKLDQFIMELPSPPILLVIIFYMVLLTLHEKKHKKLICIIVSMVICLYSFNFFVATQVYFLDIGQGDAILIKKGFETLMVDGGFQTDDKLLKQILYKQGIKSIDYVILSHGHMDHMGGLIDINQMTEESILVYKKPNQKAEYFDLLTYSDKFDSDSINEMDLGWCQFKFFPYKSYDDLNDASLVTELLIHDTRILLTGDIEERVEKDLLAVLNDVDIIKVPHHGSRTSSTMAFIKKTRPEVAVICVGKNFYGHPNQAVVTSYQKMGTEVHQTINGCLKITIYPFGFYFVKPWK